MANDLTIKVSQMEGNVPVTVLHIAGDVDANTAKELESKATEAIQNGAKDMLLDLSEVNFMASAGFRAMHTIHNTLSPGGSAESGKSSHLRVLKPSDEVRRVFKTLGFDQYLNIHEDLREAVDAF